MVSKKYFFSYDEPTQIQNHGFHCQILFRFWAQKGSKSCREPMNVGRSKCTVSLCSHELNKHFINNRTQWCTFISEPIHHVQKKLRDFFKNKHPMHQKDRIMLGSQSSVRPFVSNYLPCLKMIKINWRKYCSTPLS